MAQSKKKTREQLHPPDGKSPVLLHSCCAPCVGELMEAFIHSKIPFSIFFYNPNIHPKKEYDIRKEENIRFAKQHGIEFIDADYDPDHWFARTNGMENEPERGIRCSACFDLRFERTADYAHHHGFPVITSSLGISRWKDMNQINTSGVRAVAIYPDMVYWTFNWRKNGGSERMYQIAKREQFYKQEYCGCVYSLRDTNVWRKKNKRDLIKFGSSHYSFLET